MTEDVYYPSLDYEGWAISPATIADKLLAHFFISNYSQSGIYVGRINSFPWILQNNHGDVQQTAIMTQSALVTHLSGYFTDVQADVTGVIDADNPSKASLIIQLNFKDKNGIIHDMGRTLELLDGQFSKIVKINNG